MRRPGSNKRIAEQATLLRCVGNFSRGQLSSDNYWKNREREDCCTVKLDWISIIRHYRAHKLIVADSKATSLWQHIQDIPCKICNNVWQLGIPYGMCRAMRRRDKWWDVQQAKACSVNLRAQQVATMSRDKYKDRKGWQVWFARSTWSPLSTTPATPTPTTPPPPPTTTTTATTTTTTATTTRTTTTATTPATTTSSTSIAVQMHSSANNQVAPSPSLSGDWTGVEHHIAAGTIFMGWTSQRLIGGFMIEVLVCHIVSSNLRLSSFLRAPALRRFRQTVRKQSISNLRWNKTLLSSIFKWFKLILKPPIRRAWKWSCCSSVGSRHMTSLDHRFRAVWRQMHLKQSWSLKPRGGTRWTPPVLRACL